ncbi:MAG: hypothetical protein K0Q65_3012 [Clostridia bacterium]|jgi:hypothetical protein|nr:hypothetical protein [Clostridia bacterium]
MKKYLPIGSVVILVNGSKRIMIYGRKQIQVGTQTEWDYIGCLYPEGNINEEYMYLFNHEQIDKVFFMGYQDEEENEFLEKYLLSLDGQAIEAKDEELKFL